MADDIQATSHTCFFYGTLMNDAILRRVIGTTSDHLQIADALLKSYTRHHVKHVDYPAVVPESIGKRVLGRELTEDEGSVRGTVVKGLKSSDISLLDIFEGDEYERRSVKVSLLSSWRATTGSVTPPNEQTDSSLVSTDIYIWIASPSMLEPSLWSYEAFLREKAHMWVGNGSSDAEYLEVDRRRQMEGKIVRTPSQQSQEPSISLPRFGHEIRDKHFSMEKGYINLNNGGRGAVPKPVSEAKRRWLDRAEAAPDRFYQNEYYKLLPGVRDRVGKLLNADPDNVSFTLNATSGVNTILRSMRWQKGDHVLCYPNAVYGACYNTLLFLRDHYGVQLVEVDLMLPFTHAELINKTKQVIEKAKHELGGNGRIRLALFDAICSMPGVVLPWEELCLLFKKHDILSLVDAAHVMGHVPVDLRKTDPDFWVSNVHKWAMAPRSVAVLYVPERNHHLIESMPISFGYVHSVEPKTAETASSYKTSFAFTGTQDFSNIFSVVDALDYRQELGGEERIMEYNHNLVLEGAALIANVLQTSYMENSEKSLIAAMVNIELPVTLAKEKHAKLAPVLVNKLLEDYNISAPCFPYGERVYVRVAAQVFNEISNYEALANALKELLAKQEELVGDV